MQLPKTATVEEIAELFKKDRFATNAAGCTVIDGGRGYAVCEMVLQDHHRNGMDNVMGGAIFTLADFALAIASNVGQPPTVSVSHSIDFFRATKGAKLIAKAHCDKEGRSLAFFTVDVTDDLGKDIAKMTAVSSRVG